MRRIVIASVVSAAIVALGCAVLFGQGTGIAQGAKPVPATPLSTYVNADTVMSPSMPVAYCDSGDPLTGGGVRPAPGVITQSSYPACDSASQRWGWTGELSAALALITAYAVCLDSPPAHVP
jgi:hypothetical protein